MKMHRLRIAALLLLGCSFAVTGDTATTSIPVTRLAQVARRPAVIRSLSELGGRPYNVTYDARSLLLAGKRLLSFSGSFHYVRSTPAMWPAIFASMKASGLNTVDSYVFWNYHVRSNSTAARARPDYSGRGNVTLFLTLAAEADMFVIWRLGPYINAEWLGGGYPGWVQAACKATGTRKATQPYMDLTTEWMQSHVDTVRPFFAVNGGPIILLQMDNELGGAKPEYIAFLADLASRRTPTAAARCSSLLRSVSADVRASADAIAREGLQIRHGVAVDNVPRSAL